jgi:hypothetical protein
MGKERCPSCGGESSQRTKARHDPNLTYYFESEEEEEIEKIPELPRARRGGEVEKNLFNPNMHHILNKLLGKLHT